MSEETTTEEWTHDTMIEGLWRTGEKQEISILYEREDKSRYSGQAVRDSREWEDFFLKFTPEQVDQFTEAHKAARQAMSPRRPGAANDRQQIQKREDKQLLERRKAAEELETLFRAKLEAFEIPEVRDSENRELRSRIRKSKSLTEISALVAALIALSVIEPKAKENDEGEQTLTDVNVVPNTIGEIANEVPKDEN